MELKLPVRARRLYSYLQTCPSCAPLPPSLLCLSIIKLARFSAAGAGRGLALFERRPFKSLQTNGTGPRSAVTKPTGLSLRPELPACLPAFLRPHLPVSFGVIKLKRKNKKKKKEEEEGREGELARRDTYGKKRHFFFLRRTSQPWFVFEELPRRGCGHKQASPPERNAERRETLPAKDPRQLGPDRFGAPQAGSQSALPPPEFHTSRRPARTDWLTGCMALKSCLESVDMDI